MPGPLIGPDPDVPRWRSSLEALSLLGTNQSKSRTCLGGCIMLVESRRVYERRLRPQTGCLVQRLSCYPGECRHGDSAAPRRRTLHRQVSCRLRKPDWRPCTQPGWSGGRGGSRQSRPGPGEIEDADRQHPPAAFTVACHWAGAPSAMPSGLRHRFDLRVAAMGLARGRRVPAKSPTCQ
jgi:hypothetical protein